MALRFSPPRSSKSGGNAEYTSASSPVVLDLENDNAGELMAFSRSNRIGLRSGRADSEDGAASEAVTLLAGSETGS